MELHNTQYSFINGNFDTQVGKKEFGNDSIRKLWNRYMK